MLERYLSEIERRTSYLSYVERVEIERLIKKIREEVRDNDARD